MRKTISEYIDEIGELNRKLAAYERQKAGRGAKISNMDADGIGIDGDNINSIN